MGKVDILVLTENKLDASFSAKQFLIESFSEPFRFDRNSSGDRVLLYIREDIPFREIKLHRHPHDIEGIFVEVNLRKTKWLPFATYHPPSQVDEYFSFDDLGKSIDKYIQIYD